MKFDHIGIVAATLEKGRPVLEAIFETLEWTGEFADPVNHVYVQFGKDSSGICYELIAPLGEDAPVHTYLKTSNNILNHVAYLVPDLGASYDRMRAARSVAISDPKPAIAYGGSRIQFFMTPLRFIVELIEAPDHEHQYLSRVTSGP